MIWQVLEIKLRKVCDVWSMVLGLTSQEAVQLHQELEVRIVALGRLAVGVAHVVAVEIDTYKETKIPRQPLAQVCSENCGSTRREEVFYDLRSLSPIPLVEEIWQRPHIRRDRFRSSTCIQRLVKKFNLTYPS